MQFLASMSLSVPLLAASSSNISTPPVTPDAVNRPRLTLVPPMDTGAGPSLTDAMYERSVLEDAIDNFLSQELRRESSDAQSLARIADQLTATIRRNLPVLSATLSTEQRDRVRAIAGKASVSEQSALIEYLANASLFSSLRIYYDLQPQERVSMHDLAGGFIALSQNGSIISSSPHVRPTSNRMIHYMRMPSRNINMDPAVSTRGQLLEDVQVGHRFKSSAFRSSQVTLLLYIDPSKAREFEQLREWVATATSSIHHSVIGRHDSDS